MLKNSDDYTAALAEIKIFLDAPKAPSIRSKGAKRFEYLIDAIEDYEQSLAAQKSNLQTQLV